MSTLSNSVKEGLCESPLDWPGVHAARALVHGEPLEGYWFHRTKQWAARNRGLEVGPYDFATRYLIHFAQLPAFRHLSPEAYQNKIAELIREIEEEGEAKRDGAAVAGREKILSQNPNEPPTRKTKSSPKSWFHYASKEAGDALWSERSGYQSQHQIASEALLGGNLQAAAWFPEGCYPSALPFVGPPAPKRPPSPPTRRLILETVDAEDDEAGGKVRIIERGEIPVVEIRATVPIAAPGADRAPDVAPPKARGQPP